jgi:hypothetical protein
MGALGDSPEHEPADVSPGVVCSGLTAVGFTLAGSTPGE